MNYEQALLDSVAVSLGMKNYEFQYQEDAVKKGDGYGAEIKAVVIKDNLNQIRISLIFKYAPVVQQNQMFINCIFQREIYFYDKIVPSFQKFLRTHDKLDLFDLVPVCYGLSSDNKYLALENLKDAGYKLWKRQIPVTDHHARLVFQEYGRFHALSLAFNAKNPEEYQKLIEKISKPSPPQSQDDDPEAIKYNEILFQKTCDILKQFDKEDCLEAFKKYWSRRIDLRKVSKIDPDEYSVVLHGDAWVNNYLFKYEDKSNPNKPTGLKLLDFQLSFAGPSSLDLTTFFSLCCTKDLLKNIEEYRNIYYDSLCNTLKALNCDAKKVYPREVFDNEWRRWRSLGLYVGLLYIKLLVVEDDEVVNVAQLTDEQRQENLKKDLRNQQVLNQRIFELIRFMCDNSWLESV